jgi:hypothetical protein
MRVCKAREGVKDLPILAQSLSAVFFIRRLCGGLAGCFR